MKRKIIIFVEILSTILTVAGCIYIRYTHGEASILWCIIPAIISCVAGLAREKIKKN